MEYDILLYKCVSKGAQENGAEATYFWPIYEQFYNGWFSHASSRKF